MTDISTDTANTPGVRGQTRSSWRDGLRGLFMLLYRQHADANRAELLEFYLAEAKGPDFSASPQNEAYIDDALKRAFDNDFTAAHRSDRPQRRAAARDVSTLVDSIRAGVLLDLVMPNGKLLRDSTGEECEQAGGWLVQVGARVGRTGIVGALLSDADLVAMRAGSA
jgi:hypothetical protein